MKKNLIPSSLLAMLALTCNLSVHALEITEGLRESEGAAPRGDKVPAVTQSRPGKATKWEGHDGGLGVAWTPHGARLSCPAQRLAAEATSGGLWVDSAGGSPNQDRFRVVAVALGRDGEVTLPRSGTLAVGNSLVRFIRPGLVEEYSAGIDRIRQDFIVMESPRGGGELRVQLEVSGADLEQNPSGVQLVLKESGRKIAYGRLQVNDATGRTLPAQMIVLGKTQTARLVLVVNDEEATYPVRIDPTFTDANWVSLNPSIPGTDGPVHAVVTDGSGNLYVGGRFTVVGNVPANNIAKWDGSKWLALGNGMDDVVYALAISGSDVYAGGHFATADGTAAPFVAKWDGAHWSALGQSVNDAVRALVVSGDVLYVGGHFTTAGGAAAPFIAKWDGAQWSGLGQGMDNGVYALATSGSDIYAAGTFENAGGSSANYVAKWNGNTWSALGGGVNWYSYALAVSGDDVYVGGDFQSAGGIDARGIARWNGSGWSEVGLGMTSGVKTLAVSGSNVYAGGTFGTSSGIRYLAKWDQLVSARRKRERLRNGIGRVGE